MSTLQLNGEAIGLPDDLDLRTPLLWVVRERLGLTGSKFGCGQGLCGACTMHVDGQPVRSCILPVSQVVGKSVLTIEGLGGDHPVQQAWREIDVPQCGYCQSGQIMSAAALLAANPNPSNDDINRAMAGNICRCGSYPRIRRAIHRAATMGSAFEETGVQTFDPATEES
jgi:isoquinoline 1-oxidoreductase alpha subunit